MTDEEIEVEYLAHQYAEHGIPNEIEDENFDENLDNIEALLGIESPAEGAAAEAAAAVAEEQEINDFEDLINDKRN